MKGKILVIGACGQIGAAVTLALRQLRGTAKVIAADLKAAHPIFKDTGKFVPLNVLDKRGVHETIKKLGITQVYLLAEMPPATSEKNAALAWELNIQGLLNVLEMAKEEKNMKVFWPSSVAVCSAALPYGNCPHQTVAEPATVYGITKYAGEMWCRYYRQQYGVDVRSLRYPELLPCRFARGDSRTNYAVEILHEATKKAQCNCFLKEGPFVPVMNLADAVRATIELMEAPAEKIKMRSPLTGDKEGKKDNTSRC